MYAFSPNQLRRASPPSRGEASHHLRSQCRRRPRACVLNAARQIRQLASTVTDVEPSFRVREESQPEDAILLRLWLDQSQVQGELQLAMMSLPGAKRLLRIISYSSFPRIRLKARRSES